MTKVNYNELLKKLVDKSISDTELSLLKEESARNPFLLEAMEGYTENSITSNDLKLLGKKIGSRFQKGFSWVYPVSILISFIIAGIFIWIINTTVDPAKTPIKQTSNETEILPDTANPKQSIINSLIITDTNRLTEQVSRNIINSESKDSLPVVIKNYSNIPMLNINTISNALPEMENYRRISYTYNCPYKLINGYIVLDYLKTNRYQKQNELNFGTSANMQGKHDAGDIEKNTVNVEQLLQKGIYCFDAKDYDHALNYLNRIKELFPDDVNASFYMALCYFHLKKYSLAEEGFKAAINSQYNLFTEESNWLLANLYLNTNNKDMAKNYLNSTVKQNGFYYNLALQLLEKHAQ